MKKNYEAPFAEKITFQYKDQVVASSCESKWIDEGVDKCEDNNHLEYLK